jgi:hypothetical protein
VGDEGAVEYRQFLACRTPRFSVEGRGTALHQQFNGGVHCGSKGLAAYDEAGVAGVKGTQHRGDRRFPKSVRSKDERVFSELRIAGGGQVPEPANVF